MPTVDQLFDRYTTALGGADALAKVAGRVGKGPVTRLRSAWFPSFGEARRPASAKATAVRRSFSEGGSPAPHS